MNFDNKPKKKKSGFFKKLGLGLLGFAGGSYLYKKNKNVQKEDIKHKIEMSSLEKKLPFYERHKLFTRIAIIAALGSMYRCNDEYRDLGKATLEAFRETRQSIELSVEGVRTYAETQDTRWKQTYDDLNLQTQKATLESSKSRTKLLSVEIDLEKKTIDLYEAQKELSQRSKEVKTITAELEKLRTYKFKKETEEKIRRRVEKEIRGKYKTMLNEVEELVRSEYESRFKSNKEPKPENKIYGYDYEKFMMQNELVPVRELPENKNQFRAFKILRFKGDEYQDFNRKTSYYNLIYEDKPEKLKKKTLE